MLKSALYRRNRPSFTLDIANADLSNTPTIDINNQPCTNVTVLDFSHVSCIVPLGAGKGNALKITLNSRVLTVEADYARPTIVSVSLSTLSCFAARISLHMPIILV